MTATQEENLYDYIDQTSFGDTTKASIKAILPKVISTEKNGISLDEEDIKTILGHGGMAFAGSGQYEGEDAPMHAIKSAIRNASYDYSALGQITGALIHFRTHPRVSVVELGKAMEMIYRDTNEDAPIIFGTTADDTVSTNYTEATVLLTRNAAK